MKIHKKAVTALAIITMSLPTWAAYGGELLKQSDELASVFVGINTSFDGKPSSCSGVLIQPDIVLTAAHCVVSDPDVYLWPSVLEPKDVRVNLNVDNSIIDGNSVTVTEVVPYICYYKPCPKYKHLFDWGNDHALLRLSRKLKTKYTVKLANYIYEPDLHYCDDCKSEKFYNDNEIDPNIPYKDAEDLILFAGRGIQNAHDTTVKNDLRLRLISPKFGWIAQGIYQFDNDRKQGMCNGDSGGPLFMREGNEITVFGILRGGFFGYDENGKRYDYRPTITDKDSTGKIVTKANPHYTASVLPCGKHQKLNSTLNMMEMFDAIGGTLKRWGYATRADVKNAFFIDLTNDW